MVVDASALVAIILRESEGERCERTLAGAERPLIASPSMFETLMVLTRWMDANAAPALKRVLDTFEVEVVPCTGEHALIAYEAFSRYGKGRHPAGLNFGDCMAYAVAKVANAPLLFVGNDFTRTDIPAA